MSVKEIIEATVNKNPVEVKRLVQEELNSRVGLVINESIKLDEANWTVEIGNKTYVVKAKSTAHASEKAEKLAKAEGNRGVGGEIKRVD